MTTSSSGIDTRLFRDVCGNFATGVSVVTMVGDDGPRGLTANAISALSLDPTLFLVCVDLGATSYPVIDQAGKFAINLLADDQEAVSNFFAGTTPPDNPMGDNEYRMSDLGSPLLEGALAWLDCRTHSILDGATTRSSSARSPAARSSARTPIRSSSSAASTGASSRSSGYAPQPAPERGPSSPVRARR